MNLIALGLASLCILFIILFYAVHYAMSYFSENRKKPVLFRYRESLKRFFKLKTHLHKGDDFRQAA